MNPSLYQKLLGPDYARLPPEQAAFHALHGQYEFTGEASIQCGRHPLARVVSVLMGLPQQDAQVPLRFELIATDESETWIRHFGPQTMTSVLRYRKGWLVERLGLIVLYSRLRIVDECLKMEIVRARFLGLIAMPLWLMPSVQADETASDGQIHFVIRVVWAWLGLLVAYQGFLDVRGLAHERGGV
jgi:hypothetical protein